MKECIGCGFCCFMELCRVAATLHGEDVIDCPELIFRDGRYWCKLIEEDHKIMKHMTKGCGAVWNGWRKDVKKRTREEYIKYYDNDLLTDLVSAYDPRRKKKKD